ncbi:PREDICTED: uncharacterized protein LOC109581146 [Amphimedon queenslandica]|uniref:Uncharacterized protein n=1 Tax=Amphimedon queenslandica TaxID=400682 RepID=A0A1X7V5H6_AMPQE|nr:PREDICTED: uncharacterized protein LOC109581146 [Amphimedon queenslandica]|eukprot:XP_019850534.1 PREDICTED: uncharacterized protein LOC109581146 [Amphimedon queenslandica]
MSVSGKYLRGRKCEVHFKGQHVMHEPWEASPFRGYEKEKEVKMLRHDTHFSEADSIITSVNGDEEYQLQFKPFRKRGKGVSSTMTTYQRQSPNDVPPDNDTKYNYVSSRDELFPGCYSWWSPVDDEDQRCSLFGDIGFSAKVDDLIECYKKAFTPPLKEIQFRCGGTLRYMFRVCKVIIICPAEESQLPKEEYPIMPIKETEIKLQYEKPYTYSDCIYDEFTFVFYFPSDDMQMKCPEQAVICKKVPHGTCATKGRSCPGGRGLSEQLKLKLENMKKRREEKSEIVAIAQNVSPQATYNIESSLEEEFDQEEGGITYDQEHVMQQLEEEDLSPACENESHVFTEDDDEDDEDQEPLNKKLAMIVDDDDNN